MLDQTRLPVADERVRLRPLRASDATGYATGSADADVRSYAHLPEPEYTPESVRRMIELDAAPGLERGDLAVLAIAEAESDAFAGSLVIFDVSADGAEVGFWLHPEARGKGYASAALSLAAEFARTSGLRTLTARTVPDNIGSQRVLGAAGFEQGGSEAGIAPSGQRVELMHYTLQLRDRA